jgi:hypothetical protein
MKTSGDLVTSTPPSQNRSWRGPRVIGRSGDRKGSRSTGSYQGAGFSRAVKRKLKWALAPAFLIKAIRILGATLHEIFDESAYDRFLSQTNATRSVPSYRAFTRERDAAMLKKPRCC